MNTLPLYTKPKRKYPERNLQAAVVALLTFYARPKVMYWHVRNEAKLSRRTAGFLRKTGVRAGVADFTIVLLGGNTCQLELKSQEGRQSPAQKVFQAQCRENGTPYAIARTSEEAATILFEWGALTENPLSGPNRQPQKVAA